MDNKVENARLAALKLLHKIFAEGAYANIALSQYLSKALISDMDRRFVTELVYGTVKAKGTVDWILRQNVSRPLGKVSPVILNILRLGVYQIYYLDRIPDSAACNESVKLAKKFGHPGTVKFVNGVLRNVIRNKDKNAFPSMEEDAPLHIALSYEHPRWLVQRWLKQFGQEQTIALCQYDNASPRISLRVNTLRITREELLRQMAQEGFVAEASRWSAEGIVCTEIPSYKLLWQKFGQYLYAQDESSMLVADVLQPQAGDVVLDLCSAPGGKTTHVAQLMGNKGQVIACDIYPHKLKLVEENAKRLGLDIITTANNDATVLVDKWRGCADKVLVDAPCSGLGVLGRRAEARWSKTPQDLLTFPPLQKQILANAAQYVKAGGRLVYSTCTLETAENGAIVQEFLAEHPEYTKIEERQLLPYQDGVDGFYYCLLERSKD